MAITAPTINERILTSTLEISKEENPVWVVPPIQG
jgi:hypothetical protein